MSVSDTPPEIAEMVRARLMALSGAERFVIGARMFEAARRMVLASFPDELPRWNGIDSCSNAFTGNPSRSHESAFMHVCGAREKDGRQGERVCRGRGKGLQTGEMRMRSMSRSREERRNRSEAEIARQFAPQLLAGKQTARSAARRAMLWGRSIVNITEDVRKYAVEQAISEDEALKKGMEEKSKEFVEKGAEVYAKA